MLEIAGGTYIGSVIDASNLRLDGSGVTGDESEYRLGDVVDGLVRLLQMPGSRITQIHLPRITAQEAMDLVHVLCTPGNPLVLLDFRQCQFTPKERADFYEVVSNAMRQNGKDCEIKL
ncbi:hypothetical protein GWC77_27295 [Paraburkholderia sp. NMBU_R16]|uniref:hypothetical protein n=1 Tax=Paraburkholderia sp. NMBU_R16 TaxID=2698676 RepID=UPI001564DA01|nr:hypothetical protein [Paraburkholderia sp. NMBU_R16]NRO99570.1 hypothetical protein [Paraburkholderia sp. NMBU_R16]